MFLVNMFTYLKDIKEKQWLLSSIALAFVTTMMFFVEFTWGVYYLVGRYLILLAFVLGFIALVKLWLHAFKEHFLSGYVRAFIKTIALSSVLAVSFAILVVSHMWAAK